MPSPTCGLFPVRQASDSSRLRKEVNEKSSAEIQEAEVPSVRKVTMDSVKVAAWRCWLAITVNEDPVACNSFYYGL